MIKITRFKGTPRVGEVVKCSIRFLFVLTHFIHIVYCAMTSLHLFKLSLFWGL